MSRFCIMQVYRMRKGRGMWERDEDRKMRGAGDLQV